MKISGGTHSPANFPPPNSPPDLNPHVTTDPKLHRRRTGKPVAGVRRRKHGAPEGRASGLATPLLRWKFNDGDLSATGDDAPATGRSGSRRVRSEAVVSVSARKLAAGLWQLAPEVNCGGAKGSQCGSFDRLGFEPGVGHVRIAFPSYHSGGEYGARTKDQLQSPHSSYSPKKGTFYKFQSSLPFPKSLMEGATKWDPGYSKTSNEVYQFCSDMKLVKNQQVATVSVVSALQAELVQARTRIHELETEQHSSKKKVEHFLKKLYEERTSWMRREHRKIRAMIDDLKDQVNTHRKKCHRMDVVNSKLLNDIADAKLSAKKFMQNCEKERETRELWEEVCNELSKKVVEDKAEVEALKSKYMKIREEVEEERKMLQMAEVWREERVQMKLVDAKLILEEKYCQMNNLIADLEAFLRSRDATLDMIEMSEAGVIRQAMSSVNIHDIKEFSYVPPKSDDVYSIIEDLQNGQAKEMKIDQCLNYSPASHASEIQSASLEVNGFNKNPVQKHSNDCIDHNRGLEDFSGWETVTHVEDQGSSYTPGGSNYSVNRISRGRKFSKSSTEHEQNAGQESHNSEISEIYSASPKQLKKKASSVSKLWRSCPSNGDACKTKTISVEGNQRLLNGSTSNVGTIPPKRGSGEAGVGCQDLVAPLSSPDSGNPHITQGMKGCIEWPRGIQRSTLKAKLLEARVESQKCQLRSVLKQKS